MSEGSIGATGFEPATSWSQTTRSTKLSYAPEHCSGSLARILISCISQFQRSLVGGSSFSRLVTKICCQSLLNRGDRLAASTGIILHLITANLSDAKIFRFRMRKIESAHTRSRMHRERFRELDSGFLFGVQQIEQRLLLGMIRTCGITRCWSDTAIFFPH